MKYAITLICLFMAAIACKEIPEQPEVNEGYDNSFVMPEAEILTPEDRAIITAMEDEYDENFNK